MHLCTVESIMCRLIPDCDYDKEFLIVAPYDKREYLIAEGWDGHICYYATEAEMEFGDKELFDEIYK